MRRYRYRDVRFAEDEYSYVMNNIKTARSIYRETSEALMKAGGFLMMVETKFENGKYNEAARLAAEAVKAIRSVGGELNQKFSSISRLGQLGSDIASLAKK